jgi:protein-disulfide isomerase
MRTLFFLLILGAVTSLPLINKYLSSGGSTIFVKEDIEGIVSRYITNNPQQILDSVNNLRIRQEEKQIIERDQALFANLAMLEDDSNSPFFGSKESDIIIVEFFDYSCGYCKRAIDHKIELIKKYPDIKYIFKEMPMFGASSTIAARGALAAYLLDKDKYLDFHAALMRHRGEMTEEVLMKIARDLHINLEQYKAILNGGSADGIIQDNLNLAEQLAINATPTIIINGKYFNEPFELKSIEHRIDEIRKN